MKKYKKKLCKNGGLSEKGYLPDSPDRFNPQNIIGSSDVTMKGVPFPIVGKDEFGVTQFMLPGMDYKFPGKRVTETPMFQVGGGYDLYLPFTQQQVQSGKLKPAQGVPDTIPTIQHKVGSVYGQQYNMEDFFARQGDITNNISGFDVSNPQSVQAFQQQYNQRYKQTTGQDYFTGEGPRGIDSKFGQYTFSAPAINQPTQSVKRGVKYERLKDGNGKEYFSPVPIGNYSPSEWKSTVNSLPGDYSGIPVMKGDPYKEMFTGTTKNTQDWRTVEGNFSFDQLPQKNNPIADSRAITDEQGNMSITLGKKRRLQQGGQPVPWQQQMGDWGNNLQQFGQFMDNTINVASGIANIYDNQNKQKEYDQWMQSQMSTDGLFGNNAQPVSRGTFQKGGIIPKEWDGGSAPMGSDTFSTFRSPVYVPDTQMVPVRGLQQPMPGAHVPQPETMYATPADRIQQHKGILNQVSNNPQYNQWAENVAIPSMEAAMTVLPASGVLRHGVMNTVKHIAAEKAMLKPVHAVQNKRYDRGGAFGEVMPLMDGFGADFQIPSIPEGSAADNTRVAPSFPTPVQNTRANDTDSTGFAFNYFLDKGLAPHHAAGIVGNLAIESGNFDPNVISGKRKGDGGKAFGIAQWHPDRQKGLYSWASKNQLNPYQLETQLEYVYQEANQRGDLKRLSKAKTAEEASKIFGKHYERPNDKYAHWDKRAAVAKKLSGYKDGGTYEVTEDELVEIMRQGGQVEFL